MILTLGAADAVSGQTEGVQGQWRENNQLQQAPGNRAHNNKEQLLKLARSIAIISILVDQFHGKQTM